MSQYIFESAPDDQELRRLLLVEAALDPETISFLNQSGVTSGWSCLELGAGAGSIANWLGERVGPNGRVVAIDTKTQHLRSLSGHPFEVLDGDFATASITGNFDLAHCRYVLIHNRSSQAMLRKLAELLKPGGRAVIEEPDFTSARLLNSADRPFRTRVNNAICRMFEDLQLDPAYGLHLPVRVAETGLGIERVQSALHLHQGGSPLARMMAESARALADKYVATGEASHGDVEQYIAASSDERHWAVYYTTVTVMAIKE